MKNFVRHLSQSHVVMAGDRYSYSAFVQDAAEIVRFDQSFI